MRAVRSIAFSVLSIALALGLGLAVPANRIAAAEPDVINLINNPADNSAEVYYALDEGFFKAAGLDVRITPMTNSAAILASLAAGACDIGNSAVGTAAQARAKGIEVRFIAPAGLVQAKAPTGLLIVPKDSPIQNAADLTGKTVAVSGLNDLTYYSTRYWIDKNGGNSSAVKFVELPFPAMGAAIVQHRIDVAYDIEPFLTESKDAVRILGNAAASVSDRYMGTGWLATETWIGAHPDVARRFAAVMRQTAIWANAHHAESAAILLRHTKLDPDVLAHMNRAEYALALAPDLLQPPIDVSAKYSGQPAISAHDLMWPVPK